MDTSKNNARDTQSNRDYSRGRQTDQPYNAQPEEQQGVPQSDDDNLDDGSGATAREP